MMPPVYPEWPKSPKDLVPWPPVDGPKLKAFDFRGPRDQEVRPVCYYGEPFNAECRAFGRLQETGYEALAVPCHGYILLDEEHEKTLMDCFGGYHADTEIQVHFNGTGDEPDNDDWDSDDGPKPESRYDIRAAYPTSDGRRPPLRGILKALGTELRELNASTARGILSLTMQLQQLGIIDLDIAIRQFINGKIAEFSTALTFPHFLASPELNPLLGPSDLSAMEGELFRYAFNDYSRFDIMIFEWNEECKQKKKPRRCLDVRAFSEASSRSNRGRRIWTYVDVRKSRTVGKQKTVPRISKGLDRYSSPSRWYWGMENDENIRRYGTVDKLGWEIRQGRMFPVKRVYTYGNWG